MSEEAGLKYMADVIVNIIHVVLAESLRPISTRVIAVMVFVLMVVATELPSCGFIAARQCA